MKVFILGLTLLVSMSSFASLKTNLKNVGDSLTIQNEKDLRNVLEKKCLRDQLVDSNAAKIRVVVGQRLSSLRLKVSADSFLGKHIVVDAEYLQSESDGNTIPAGTEFRCSLDLSKPSFVNRN
jgi:hypothetical protein